MAFELQAPIMPSTKRLLRSMLESSPFSLGTFRGHETALTYSGHEFNVADTLGESGRSLLGNGEVLHIDMHALLLCQAHHSKGMWHLQAWHT